SAMSPRCSAGHSDLHSFPTRRSSDLTVLERFSLTQQALAERLGCTQSAVANKLRLLKLPEAVQEQVSRGLLSERHARALLRLEEDRKSTRLNSSHVKISYAVFCLKKK